MGSQAPFSATEFLSAMAQGGQSAEAQARQFMAHYRSRLRAVMFAKGVDAQDLDDLIAAVFEAVIRGWPSLKAPQAFHTWVMAIAENLLKKHWAERGRRRGLMTDDGPPGLDDSQEFGVMLSMLETVPDDTLGDPMVAMCLKGQLAQFCREHPQRQGCVDLLVQGYDAREMAELLGRSYGATRQFISQCCAVLLRYLGPCLDNEAAPNLRRGRASQGEKESAS